MCRVQTIVSPPPPPPPPPTEAETYITLSKQLRKRYIQHASTADQDAMQVDTRMVQLKEDASDELRELDYYTRLETAEEFKDEVESVSLKQVMRIITAAMPGT